MPRPVLGACLDLAWLQDPRQLIDLHGCYGERMWKRTGKHITERGKERERERRRECFVKLGLYYLRFGKNQALFQNNQFTSQFFTGLLWVLPLTNPFPKSSRGPYQIQSFSQARQTELCGQLPLCHLGFYCACARQRNFPFIVYSSPTS